MSTAFERELKAILSGDENLLRKFCRTFDEDVKGMYHKIQYKPFVVIRAAGSFGMDLVALRGDISFPIEVKTSLQETINLSNPVLHEQMESMIDICNKTGLVPIYAYKLKYVKGDDPWRLFTLDIDIDKLYGSMRIFHKRIPHIGKTIHGNYIIRWGEGMPLHKFIDYLC